MPGLPMDSPRAAHAPKSNSPATTSPMSNANAARPKTRSLSFAATAPRRSPSHATANCHRSRRSMPELPPKCSTADPMSALPNNRCAAPMPRSASPRQTFIPTSPSTPQPVSSHSMPSVSWIGKTACSRSAPASPHQCSMPDPTAQTSMRRSAPAMKPSPTTATRSSSRCAKSKTRCSI